MFNFSDVTCIVSNKYSFVGFLEEEDQVYFYLPKGFQDCLKDLNTFKAKRDLFFLLYKTFRKFKAVCTDKGYLTPGDQMLTLDRDGLLDGESGSGIALELDEPIIFYSKLDKIGTLLDAYDDYKIAALGCRLQRTEDIDLSKIHKYLHQGIFLPNGSVYVDSMILSRQQIKFESTDIIALYCYLVREIKLQLGDDISPETNSLAENFSHRYLGAEDSLFVEHSCDIVANSLKDALDIIDQRTPVKDSDYAQFYDVIEQFLYGEWQQNEDGKIWGINNFHCVWESICLNYIAKNVPIRNLLFIDQTFISEKLLEKWSKSEKIMDLANIFQVNGRRLIPDAVISPSLKEIELDNFNYALYPSDWDDYGYRTTFSCSGSDFQRQICLTYLNQPKHSHTSITLDHMYNPEISGLTINSPLPGNYYSYWRISQTTVEKRKNIVIPFTAHWNAMKYLNHIFYIAIRKGCTSFQSFCNELVNMISVRSNASTFEGDNVFSDSMFRIETVASLEKEFDLFLEKSSKYIAHLSEFEIVDIKYLDVNYFKSPENVESLKERSVRKQFVYEYFPGLFHSK
jgi:hypothetical protein